MKKIIKLLFLILIMIFVFNINEKNYTYKDNGIMYALKIDNQKVNSFPEKGLYKVSVDCKNAEGAWLYEEWKLAIENISGDVSCNINFSTQNKIYLNDYIISLAVSSQGNGKVIDENGFRYEGKNPNNYVQFNNELWRIIGVFDSASHGISNKNLVKIIRSESLDGIAWDKSNTNNWGSASLNKLLNGAYYNAEDGTESGYCYGYSTMSKANCNYVYRGIQNNYRNFIVNVTWYLGGYSSLYQTTEAFYNAERSSSVYKGRPTSSTGYIGLMYPSDYGYSVLGSECDRTTNLVNYNYSCAGLSWLYLGFKEWCITHSINKSASVSYLSYDSSIDRGSMDTSDSGTTGTYHGFGHRPVLYLNSSVYIIDGDGSITNPYIIAM